MSLSDKNSSNRPKTALNEYQPHNFALEPTAAHIDEDRTTTVSDNSYQRFARDSSNSGPIVGPPLSARSSGSYTHRILHSSVLSLEDLSKCQVSPQQHHSVQTLHTPPPDQNKSKGFFDRMRTSSSRPSVWETKSGTLSSDGSRPNITRRITSHDAPSTTSRLIFKPISTARESRAEYEASHSLNLIHPSFAHENFQPDPLNQSEQVNSVTPPKDLTNRLSFHTDHNDSKSNTRSSTPDEPRYRHPLRDSILTSFLKLPNRHSGQNSSEVNHQQGSPSTRNSNWHRSCQSVSQISLISQENLNTGSVNDQHLDLSGQQYHFNHPNQFQQPETQNMAPSNSSATNRRAADTKLSLQLQQEARDNSSSNYNRSQFSNNQPSTPGMSPSFQGNQTQSLRSASQRDTFNSTQNEQAQCTPAQPAHERDSNDNNYKELVIKYKKVKSLYFEKTAQVEQLQNTLANQRLSQSRTSLDDSEYMTRFQRLEGAITNLAFNIRKDWQSVPSWLSQSVNHDAIKIGKQEMTAVGRAVITKFLVDEIFDQIFHPGLPAELSRSLKVIEKNIRRFCPAHNNHEESEALTARVVQWRLTTLDGLKDVLAPPESEENKIKFISKYADSLTSLLASFLQEPKPPGIEDSAHIIVELAVNIASNLPLESRDICITYPTPGSVLRSTIMKEENPIPMLMETIADIKENESTQSGDENGKDKRGQGVLQAILAGNSSGKKGEESSQKVRFSGFVGVEVRGRQVLYKAPVWTITNTSDF